MQGPCQPDSDSAQVDPRPLHPGVWPGTPAQQYSEQAWSQVHQPVNPYTPADFMQTDSYSHLLTPTQVEYSASQPSPSAPAASMQHDVASSQFYQQQHPDPWLVSQTRLDNRLADLHEPAEPATFTSLFQPTQAVPLPLSSQQQVGQSPPMTQPNQGVTQAFSYMRPVYCSQSCPSGSGNCCFQYAFHQHHHHIVPAGPGNAPFIYTGLPSVAYVASTPVSPPASPAGNGEQGLFQPSEGSPTTQAQLQDHRLLNWFAAQQMWRHEKPLQIQQSIQHEMPHNLDVYALTQLSQGQTSAAPLSSYVGPDLTSDPHSPPGSTTHGRVSQSPVHIGNFQQQRAVDSRQGTVSFQTWPKGL